ncbi:DUF4132 domain-containing protein [Actinomadura harenae]|uniref:DUF4132 domain-containing protein n=1 Tax=Actinomadura harenae TaxID=2483351 RepID=A0A3M2LU17_9ACTN|nr:DUF4132 domain-containing protein [Actinomadura harenae]RMI40969.1 DUF4132 domain-containing protein [Actinomadura harenae]
MPELKDAPASALPDLLVNPPWQREPKSKEPIVLKGLKAPKEPTVVTWAPGQREEWLTAPYEKRGWERLPDDTDWEQVADDFATERVRAEPLRRLHTLATNLFTQAPLELGATLLADERYWDVLTGYPMSYGVRAAVARHEMAAYPMALYEAKNVRVFAALEPFLDADVAQVMIKHWGVYPNDDQATSWFETHGPAAARLTVPDALRKPGPKRTRAEEALRLVAERHGHDAVVEAARHYGEEAVAAIAALKTDPLDLYPDPLPPVPPGFAPERLPRILLRGREFALPADVTRHVITMVSISTPSEPYPALAQLIEACDPASLAAFAWALYQADDSAKWASPGVQWALINLADDEVADLLAPSVARWSKAYVWDRGGTSALEVFSRLGTDSALRHLHRLALKAEDAKRMRPWAAGALKRIARDRGMTPEQLADRLVPDLGLDTEGTMTLDYGHRRFVVGFDEQLTPYVTDEDGKRRKTLPKPGVKDDPTSAPAAYKRFGDLKKEVRTTAAEQVKRLEQAMVSGRDWTAGEFRSLFAGHPLLRHIVGRLVWSAEADGSVTTFRIAEDRAFVDVRGAGFTLPESARVALPHVLRLDGEEADAWRRLFADHEILQPFPQLERAVHALTDEERETGNLTRFDRLTVHFGRVIGMTGRGWELGEKETGGFRRQIGLVTPDERYLEVQIDPGIRVISPYDYPDQEITRVGLFTGRYPGARLSIGALDPVAASEILADLAHLTENAVPPE